MIYPLVFVFLSLFAALKKPNIGFILILLHQFIFMWIALKFAPNLYSSIGTGGTMLIYSLSGIYYLKAPEIYKRYFKFLFFFYAIFIFNLFLLSIYHSLSLSLYIHFFRNYFHSFLILPLILVAFQSKWKLIPYALGAVIVLQTVLTLGQIFFPSLKDILFIEFINRGDGFERLVSESVVKGSTTVGTFIRPANLGNFLAICLPSLYYLKTTGSLRINNFLFYTIFGLSLFVLIKTGIRTSFVSFLIISLGVLFLENRKRLLLILLGGLLVIFSLGTLLNEISKNYSREDGFENPFIRLIAGLNPFGNSIATDSTLVRTTNILEYTNEILWGNSIYISGGYYKGISSITDATLGFLFVEFGILSMFLVFIPFLYPLKVLKSNNLIYNNDFKFAALLFFGVLSQTITDQGFFTAYSAIPFFSIIGFLIARNKFQD